MEIASHAFIALATGAAIGVNVIALALHYIGLHGRLSRLEAKVEMVCRGLGKGEEH